MSNKKLCYYAVAKYVSDIVRNEPKNIGIILFNEEDKFYKVKFITNLKHKLGGSLLVSDKEVINSYTKYFSDLAPTSKEEISKIITKNSGKFQFSEINGVATDDIENELEYLYRTFIEETESTPVKKHRLKTTLKKEFRDQKIIGKNKFQVDQEIKAGKITHKVDFSYQNGKLYTIEAVDLLVSDKRANAIETAFKFENMLVNKGSRKVKTISVIQKPVVESDTDKELIYILKTFSTVYNFSNGQRKKFFKDIEAILK